MVRSDIAMQAGAQSVSQPPTPRAFVITLSVDDAANMIELIAGHQSDRAEGAYLHASRRLAAWRGRSASAWVTKRRRNAIN